jgi:hypothetical protein
MTTFEVQATTLKSAEGFHTYATLVMMMLNSVPVNGFTFLQMEQRLNMLTKLKTAKVGDKLKFEDEDFAIVIALEPHMTFNLIHKDFVDFGKYLRSLAKSPVTNKKA